MEYYSILKRLWGPSWGDKSRTKRERKQRWLDHAANANNLLLPSFNFHLQHDTLERKYFSFDLNLDRHDTVLASCTTFTSSIWIKNSPLEKDLRRVLISSTHKCPYMLYWFCSRSWAEKLTRNSIHFYYVYQHWITFNYSNQVVNILYCAVMQAMLCQEKSLLVLVLLLFLL